MVMQVPLDVSEASAVLDQSLKDIYLLVLKCIVK